MFAVILALVVTVIPTAIPAIAPALQVLIGAGEWHMTLGAVLPF